LANANTVEVRVLGELEVRLGGRRAALPASKKTRALLGYLVVTGTPQLREHLCDLLWQGPDDPRGALRWSLTKLRGVLGTEAIGADRERAWFDRADAACDAARVHRAVAVGVRSVPVETLRETLSRFRGEMLDGLDLPDCYRYHEWCVAQREAARSLRLEILAALVDHSSDEPEAALKYARQRLSIDPVNEAAHVAVVKLLTIAGRNREADEQMETCRRILSQELGTKPSPALVAARVRPDSRGPTPTPTPTPTATQTPTPTPTPTPAPNPAAADRTSARARDDGPAPPLVGRTQELQRLAAAWSAAQEGGSHGALLVLGEPGIGKTRLVDELASRATAAGARVLRGRAFEAEMIRPLGPWIDALRSARLGSEAGTYADALAPILPELGTGGAAPVDRARFYDGAVGVLRALSVDHGCLVALDDLQWFDEASVALLHFAVRGLAPSRVLIACTARGDELAESPGVIRLVRALQREGRVQEIALGPLDEAHTRAIARAVDATADDQRIAVESSGNPLFALELARAAGFGAGATESLDALLADRLDRLDSRARELLPWAAALGRGFRPDLLARVTGTADGDLLVALAILEQRGVLKAHPAAADGGYDFSHDLVRAAAYRRLSIPRRRFVHERIARTLAQLATSDPALHGDVAHHAALAGEHELAARSCIAAAERCVRMFAGDEAARLAESGLPHADRLPPSARIAARIALLQLKAMSGRWLRRSRELASELSHAVVEARDAGMHAEVATGFHALSYLQREEGDLPGARDSTLRAVEAARAADPLTRGRQLAQTARCLIVLERDMGQAVGMIDEAAALLPEHERDFNWCSARALERSFEDAPNADDLLEHSLGLARHDQECFWEVECLISLVQRALDHNDPARALAWCRELTPVAAKMTGSDGAVADALEALARVASCIAGADEHLERALGRLRDVDAKGMLAYVLVAAAEIDRTAGRLDRAQSRAGEALVAAEIVQRRSLVAAARASLADVAIARGDSARAAEHVEAVEADIARPHAISAAVRARVHRVADKLASSGGAAYVGPGARR
jgi:DNA-binding SARP family transcriptional activator